PLNITISTNTSWAVPNQTYFPSLAPGETRPFMVNYTPPFTNGTANITIMGDEPNAGKRNDTVLVIVLEVCGFDLTNYTVFYGAYQPDSISIEKYIGISNTGNVPIEISISGVPWNGFPVSNTRYALVSGDFSNKAQLQTYLVPLTTLPIGGLQNLYLQVYVPARTPKGIYNQTITMEGVCP
ncbi:MAG: hypothetical protein QW035_04470, partial [Candidatus Anstonellales archaeon]